MAQIDLFYRFGAALVIGMLVGLQREHAFYAEHQAAARGIFAGVRTFALLGLVGSLGAFAAAELASPWAFVGLILVVGGLLTVSHFVSASRGEVGLTTEVSALVTVLAGALCYWGYLPLAVAIAVATTLLLALKLEMQAFIQRITRGDVYATLKFAVITAIVLPVIPNRTLGPPPLDVVNLYQVWLMVVLISGISFLGYVLIKLVGSSQRGIGLTGLLGGLVSSTAVTLSFAQRSQKETELVRPFALAILVAWAVMFFRIIVQVAVLNVRLLEVLWLPMAASAVVALGYSGYLYLVQRTDEQGGIAFSNPFELKPAITFGVVYFVILLVSRAAQLYLGESGLYLSSILAGLVDLNAITLSMAELSRDVQSVDTRIAARAVVLAAMSNTVVKGGIVLFAGSPQLRRASLPGFIMILLVGLVLAFVV